MKEDYQRFFSAAKKEPKNFNSVQNAPLMFQHKDHSVRVLQVCPPPWLHIRLGVVNHTFQKMKNVIPEVQEWPRRLHLHEERYHGSGYEGNEVEKLLKNTDLLEEILSQIGKLEVGAKYLSIFHMFQSVSLLLHCSRRFCT